MQAEILSYSRSKGLFAGISLEGSTLRQDHKANERIYGRKITAREILLAHNVRIPASGRHLVRVLQKSAPRNESKEAASN
jgi:lipid-binding SYLF domain-containing protein